MTKPTLSPRFHGMRSTLSIEPDLAAAVQERTLIHTSEGAKGPASPCSAELDGVRLVVQTVKVPSTTGIA